jgi:hypothetical protein
MKFKRIFTHHPFFIRLFHWEYWSFHTIYFFLYPVYVWFCIRAGFRYFFSASNPTIAYGGFLMEQKHEIYPLIPAQLYPAFFLVKTGTPANDILLLIQEHGFSFPIIAKPNIGMQGKAVKKINNTEELIHYAQISTVDFLVQTLSPYEEEVGIFYVRMPNETNGRVTGIVAKEPMKVTGNGVSTLYELILQEPRYILQINALQQMHGAGLQSVLAKGEEKILAPYGNHARGSKFLDWSFKIDEALSANIDAACKKIDGFYYGRMDIMYNNWEDLRTTSNFHIIELNGAGSDPTHIYDPSHSLLFAWKEIVRHWLLLWRVSKQNHAKGHRYMTLKEGSLMFQQNKQLVMRLDEMSKKL